MPTTVPRSRLWKRPARWANLAGILASLVTVAVLVVSPGQAMAALNYTGIIRNWTTGNCLDSNHAGNVYAIGCNGGNYQGWKLEYAKTRSGMDGYRMVNQQTGRCLDSNQRQMVYTLPCNGGPYQTWRFYNPTGDGIHYWLIDDATGYVLYNLGTGVQTGRYAGGETDYMQWRPGW